MSTTNQTFPYLSTLLFSLTENRSTYGNRNNCAGNSILKAANLTANHASINSGYNGFCDDHMRREGSGWMFSLLQQMRDERTFQRATETILIIAFTFFATFGTAGNGLVCFVIARKPHMRTPRNIFILNLALSDLTLCVFTQPLNLYLLIQTQWNLGSFMCKLVTMFQGTNVFVSTISITAIAMDRFQVIVYPNKDSTKRMSVVTGILLVWIISFLMASPSLIFQRLDVYPPLKEEFPEFYLFNCIEDGNSIIEKRAYAVAQIVVQYILPFAIVSVAYLQICNKLRYRMVNQQLGARGKMPDQANKSHRQQPTEQQERRKQRKRKTNFLLFAVAVNFALSWMPLNIFNLLSEFHHELFQGVFNSTVNNGITGDTEQATSFDKSMNIDLAYALCHMLVLCSACVNPVIYGWFNDNFKVEFLKILCGTRCRHFTVVCRTLICRRRPTKELPAITLTKVANGRAIRKLSVSLTYGKDALNVCSNDDDTSVNLLTVVTSAS